MTPTRFLPRPGEKVRLFDNDFEIQAHPAAPELAWGWEGGRATVYPVIGPEPFRPTRERVTLALKVFHRPFRSAMNVSSSWRLNLIRDLHGMVAAKRWCVEPSEPGNAANDPTAYAILMPFVKGMTWYSFRESFFTSRQTLKASQSVNLAKQLLMVLAGLEAANIAHTDISPDNVVFDLSKATIQLIDLEDVYTPAALRPLIAVHGTAGYQHPGGESTWAPAGDRFSAAVLAAEFVLMSDPELADRIAAGGLSGGEDLISESSLLADALTCLHRLTPDFASLLKKCLIAPSLADCPEISALYEAIARVENAPSSPLPPVRAVPLGSPQVVPTTEVDRSTQTKANEIFFAYSHTDSKLKEQLEAHLAPLKRAGVVTIWHDRKILPGTPWQQEIDLHLRSANLIVLLISSDFLNSDYCYCEEMQAALKRHDSGSARVIPVIARDVDWGASPFSKLQALPIKTAGSCRLGGGQTKTVLCGPLCKKSGALLRNRASSHRLEGMWRAETPHPI